MAMTVVVTQNVADRFRGFLASCMLEIAPGVYTSPRMTAAIRERVWRVMSDWFAELGGSSVVMTYRDKESPSGQRVMVLGLPARELVVHDDLFLVRREIPAALLGDQRAGVGVYSSETPSDSSLKTE